MKALEAETKNETHPSAGCASNLNFSEEAFSYSSENEEGSQVTRPVIVPDPVESDRQYDRYYHLDLPGAELSDLENELAALKPLLWWKIDDTGWLRERTKRLEAELATRRYAKGSRK